MSALTASARYFGFLASAVIVIVFGVRACWNSVYPTNSFRYRLTVTVETPEGVKTGSSVIEVTERRQPQFGDSPSGKRSIRGEAVTVDLGQRGLLFVLLKDNSQSPGFDSEAGVIVYSLFPTARGMAGAALPENLRRYQEQTLSARLNLAQIPPDGAVSRSDGAGDGRARRPRQSRRELRTRRPPARSHAEHDARSSDERHPNVLAMDQWAPKRELSGRSKN